MQHGRAEEKRLAHDNLAAMLRHRMRTTPGALLKERDGGLMFTVGRPVASAHLNGALRSDTQAGASAMLEAIRHFFGSSVPAYVVWVRDGADADLERRLLDEGFVCLRRPGVPCMIRRRPFPEAPTPADLNLERVEDERGAAAYARVVMTAFELEADVAQAVFGVVGLVHSNVAAFVVRSGDTPVGAALTLVADEVAGIYYVGTIPEARGRGLGALCTRLATNAAFDRGARFVVLQASLLGEPLYRRMGYELLYYYRWYRPA